MTHAAMPGMMDCPTCAATIAFDRRFVPWCSACDWNVDAGSPPPVRASRLQRRRAAITRRLADGSFRQLVDRSAVRPPRWSRSSAILWVASIAIIGAWVLLLVLGIRLILSGFPIVVVLGGVVLLVAAVSRPRLGGAPEHALTRDGAPELYRLVDDLAELLHAPRVHTIGLDGNWNAGTYRYGPLQRTALVLGIPVWRCLSDPARLALLTHEVAHSVNGDTTRGVIEGTALRTLDAWAEITEPENLDSGDEGLIGLVAIPANLLLMAVSLAFAGLGTALETVIVRPRLRAEFYADRLAASVAGAPAMREVLMRLYLDGAYARAISAIALGSRQPGELFDELDTQVALTPASELERRRRREAAGELGTDVTHPPTPQRISLLEGTTPAAEPRMPIDPERMRRIDAEIARHEARVAGDVLDEYHATLY